MMVLGMSLYNLLLHNNLGFVPLAAGLVPGFVVAFILDVFVVGVIAKKIAFRLPIKKEKVVNRAITSEKEFEWLWIQLFHFLIYP